MFEVRGEAEAGLVPRLFAPFGRRDVVVDRVSIRRSGQTLLVAIGVEALSSSMLPTIEGNLRQIVGVTHLTVVLRKQGGRCPVSYGNDTLPYCEAG